MSDFVAKTLAETAGAFERAVFFERHATMNGFLQRLTPPVKVVSFAALLITAAFLPSIQSLAVVYLFTVLLTAASRISLRYFLKRVWFFVLLFTGIVVIPALFNVITPGDTLWEVYRFSHVRHLGPYTIPGTLALTRQGLETACLLLLRVATSVSLAMLLVMTTRWIHVLKALSVLKCPAAAILVLGMTHRYIFLFLKQVEEMYLARRSRMIDRAGLAEGHRWLSAGVGVLFGKSMYLSREVHLAMLSRGWTGRPELPEPFRAGKLDVLWLVFVGAGIFFILFFG